MSLHPQTAKNEAAPGQEAAFTSDSNYKTEQSTTTADVNLRTISREWRPNNHSDLEEEVFDGLVEPFPISSFPEALRCVSSELAEVYQIPVSLAAMSALAVMSGAVGKSVAVKGGRRDLITMLNLYVIAIAERGSGKGIAGQKLASPVINRSSQLAEAYKTKMAGWESEFGLLQAEIKTLQHEAAKATGNERERLEADLAAKSHRKAELEAAGKRSVTLWCGDTTSEALFRNLADNDEALFSYSSEAGGPVKVALGKYTANGKGDFDLLLSSYSGDSCRNDRVARGSLELKEPRLALLWMVQTCVVDEILGDRDAVARGLTARPLIFDSGARRQKDDRRDLAFTRDEQWESFIGGILDTRLSNPVDIPLLIVCKPDAVEIFAALNDETVDLENGRYPDLPGELSRWRENAIKIAGLFALAEGSPTVTADHAKRAVAVVRWCGFNYLNMLERGRRIRLHSEVQRLWNLVVQSPGGEVPVGEIERRHGFSRNKLEMLTEVFPELLETYTYPPSGPGRPKTVLRQPLNPTNSTN
jgi:hypothetical protein